MKRVLVLHGLSSHMRQTTFEFAMSFRRYAPSDCQVQYHNIRNPELPASLSEGFDALIMTYDILGLRSSIQWEWVVETTEKIRTGCDRLLAFPQDDYTCNKILDEGLNVLNADVIYTPIENGHEIVYPIMSNRAEIRQVLTGYVDTAAAEKYLSSWIPMEERTIDVGTRVRLLSPWLGRSGQRKGFFAEKFHQLAESVGMISDISTKDEDVFFGEEWYEFLGSCRTTIAQKGGASLCDPDGSLMETVKGFLEENPEASFEEIEQSCFPNQDGLAEMSAISPRIFDAAMVGAAQILVEGDYLGVLEPWQHYIPTDPEISNIEEILEIIRQPMALEQIADNAAEVLIREERFTYKQFVEDIFNESVFESGRRRIPVDRSLAEKIQWRVTPEMFEGLQHLLYLARATDSIEELSNFLNDVVKLVDSHPEVISHLDEKFLRTLLNWHPIHPVLDNISGPITDLLRECTRHGAIDLYASLSAIATQKNLSDWHFLEWTEADQIELMIAGEPLHSK